MGSQSPVAALGTALIRVTTPWRRESGTEAKMTQYGLLPVTRAGREGLVIWPVVTQIYWHSPLHTWTLEHCHCVLTLWPRWFAKETVDCRNHQILHSDFTKHLLPVFYLAALSDNKFMSYLWQNHQSVCSGTCVSSLQWLQGNAYNIFVPYFWQCFQIRGKY